MSSMPIRLFVAAAASAVALSTSGCLVSVSSSEEISGTRVSSSTLEQIEAGVTTASWPEATIGEPSERRPVADAPDTSIWRYDHVRRSSGHGSVFLVLNARDKSVETTSTFFELRDGVVERWWTDGAALGAAPDGACPVQDDGPAEAGSEESSAGAVDPAA